MHSRTTKVGISKNRSDSRLIMLLQRSEGCSQYSHVAIRHVRKHHSLAFQIPFGNTDLHKPVSSPRLLEIGTILPILSFLLLKAQKLLLLSLLLL